MSKYKSGILGAISGKVGNAVCYKQKGQNIIRSRTQARNKPENKGRYSNSIGIARTSLLWHQSRPLINFLMSIFNVQGTLSYNQFVKESINNSLESNRSYINNLNIGESQFNASFFYGDIVFVVPSLIQLWLHNISSTKIQGINVKQQWGYYLQSTHSWHHFSSSVSNNSVGTGFDITLEPSGSFVLLYSVIRTVDNLTSSQLGISAMIVP